MSLCISVLYCGECKAGRAKENPVAGISLLLPKSTKDAARFTTDGSLSTVHMPSQQNPHIIFPNSNSRAKIKMYLLPKMWFCATVKDNHLIVAPAVQTL